MITIHFEAQELDYVLKVLAQRPWGEVNALFTKLQQQIQPPPPPTGNGLDKNIGEQHVP
jgi:hypothetical protein